MAMDYKLINFKLIDIHDYMSGVVDILTGIGIAEAEIPMLLIKLDLMMINKYNIYIRIGDSMCWKDNFADMIEKAILTSDQYGIRFIRRATKNKDILIVPKYLGGFKQDEIDIKKQLEDTIDAYKIDLAQFNHDLNAANGIGDNIIFDEY